MVVDQAAAVQIPAFGWDTDRNHYSSGYRGWRDSCIVERPEVVLARVDDMDNIRPKGW